MRRAERASALEEIAHSGVGMFAARLSGSIKTPPNFKSFSARARKYLDLSSPTLLIRSSICLRSSRSKLIETFVWPGLLFGFFIDWPEDG